MRADVKGVVNASSQRVIPCCLPAARKISGYRRKVNPATLNDLNKLVQQLADPWNCITVRKQGNFAFLADQGNQSNLFHLKLMIFWLSFLQLNVWYINRTFHPAGVSWHVIKKRSLLQSAGLSSNKCRCDGIFSSSEICSVNSLCGSSRAVFATALSGPTNMRTTEDFFMPAILQNHDVSKHSESYKPRNCCGWVSTIRSFD